MDFEKTRNSLPIITHRPNFVESERNKLEQKIKQLIRWLEYMHNKLDMAIYHVSKQCVIQG